MSKHSLASASGLRPTSAFVVIGAVVAVVASYLAILSSMRTAAQPTRLANESSERPIYSIADRNGRTLARFVPRFQLEMSPRSMWQAHTPARMATGLSEQLGGEPTPDELLGLMFPDAEQGEIRVPAPLLTPMQALRLTEWVDNGLDPDEKLRGVRVEQVTTEEGRTAYQIVWRPLEVLTKEQRERFGTSSAWRWARRLAMGIHTALHGPRDSEPVAPKEWDRRIDAVWAALLPSAHQLVVQSLPSERVIELRKYLAKEAVASYQMRIAYERDRLYPCGEHELIGDWGFLDDEQTDRSPRQGLELFCDRLLDRPEWGFLEYRPATYAWRRDRTIRGQRSQEFLAYSPASEPPVVRSTLDISLQRFVGSELERAREEHAAAIAMGIVLEVQTGAILALDVSEKYAIGPFAPLYHVFTPGSTFKLCTMAVALEERAVQMGETFDVGHGSYTLVDPEGKRRVIREAEGSKTGVLTLSQTVAFSLNAGLVQVGLKVPDVRFRRYLDDLGYGRVAYTGLGVEGNGSLPELPWSYRFTHASISFGHEISTTLWQHATALSAIVRGGVVRPLSIVAGVEQAGERYPVDRPQDLRVFSTSTTDRVRSMMELGATAGTGRRIRDSLIERFERPDLLLATKTGTTEKVHSETCLHLEYEALAAARERGANALTKAEQRALRGKRSGHTTCYTSSMCAVGVDERGREILVLVVVDEPTGKVKFGADVAGPAAGRILAEALGWTRIGERLEPTLAHGFGRSQAIEASAPAEPWRLEDGEAGRW